MAFFDSRHQRAAMVLGLLAIGLAIGLAPYASGLIAVPDQVIDYTWGRRSTFHEGEDRGFRVAHTFPLTLQRGNDRSVFLLQHLVDLPLLRNLQDV